MKARSILLAATCAAVAACGGPSESPSPPPATIRLSYMPANAACMLAAPPSPLTIRIDGAALDDVVAIAPDGRQIHIFWAEGFVGGRTEDRVVLDPRGAVVARDGAILATPARGGLTLGGYTVCFGSDSLWVFLTPLS